MSGASSGSFDGRSGSLDNLLTDEAHFSVVAAGGEAGTGLGAREGVTGTPLREPPRNALFDISHLPFSACERGDSLAQAWDVFCATQQVVADSV